MIAIALGLSSAACWGTADFLGGLSTRRAPVLRVLLVSQAFGLVLAAVVVVASGEPAPPASAMAQAAVAGLAGVTALGAFYRALAIGTMSIVAPISATGAAVPVIVGLATGDRPGVLALGGMAVAVVGVVLASRELHDDAERAAAGRLSIVLALVAALGFGTFFVAIDAAADAGQAWALLPNRIAGVAVLGLIAAAVRLPARPPAGDWAPLAAVGVLDASANGLFVLASTRGLLSVTSVLASLYPLTTILLARGLLGERIRRVQEVGVVAALVGVVLIAAG